jgi:hypothetical protein
VDLDNEGHERRPPIFFFVLQVVSTLLSAASAYPLVCHRHNSYATVSMATEKGIDDRKGVEHLSDNDAHSPDHLGADRRGSLLIRNAKAATDKEHKMTLMQGLRLYPKAVRTEELTLRRDATERTRVLVKPTNYSIGRMEYGRKCSP